MTEEPASKKPKNSRKGFQWNTEKIMSTSALFISVISLIALLYQSYLAREENKLIQKQQSASVLPHLSQWYSEFDNSFKFVIGNKGVGPAFIENVEITLDANQIFDNTDDLFKEIFENSSKLDTMPYTTSTLIKGFVLPANEKINIIEVSGLQNIQLFKEVISKKKIVYKITYNDVYDSKWILTNENDIETSTNIPLDTDK